MKNDNNIRVSFNGMFLQLLTIVFIILKLCKVISWSWIWVLCPLWGSLVIVCLACMIILILRGDDLEN